MIEQAVERLRSWFWLSLGHLVDRRRGQRRRLDLGSAGICLDCETLQHWGRHQCRSCSSTALHPVATFVDRGWQAPEVSR